MIQNGRLIRPGQFDKNTDFVSKSNTETQVLNGSVVIKKVTCRKAEVDELQVSTTGVLQSLAVQGSSDHVGLSTFTNSKHTGLATFNAGLRTGPNEFVVDGADGDVSVGKNIKLYAKTGDIHCTRLISAAQDQMLLDLRTELHSAMEQLSDQTNSVLESLMQQLEFLSRQTLESQHRLTDLEHRVSQQEQKDILALAFKE